MNSDGLIIGAGAAILLAWYLSKGKTLTPSTAASAATASAPTPVIGTAAVPNILNGGGAPMNIGGGGDSGGNNYAPMLQPSGGGFYDPFNTDFFNQTGWWAKQSYHDEYPVAPGVIDVTQL